MGSPVSRVKVLSYRTPGFKFDSETMIDITRKSPWGNPFIMGIDGSIRDEVVMLHILWLSKWIMSKNERIIRIGIRVYSNKWVVENIRELRGKQLVCWCSPEACHGDILILLANVS